MYEYLLGEFTNRKVVTRREVHGQTRRGFKPSILHILLR